MSQRGPSSILIGLGALLLLALLSLCPWDAWTGGSLKRFGLLSHLAPEGDGVNPQLAQQASQVDPELIAYASEADSTSSDTVVQPPSRTPLSEAPEKSDGTILIEDYSPEGNGLERLATTLSQARRRPVRIAMLGDSYIEGDILAQDIRAGLQQRYGGRGVGYMSAFSTFPGFRNSVRQSADRWDETEIRQMNNDPLRTILGHYHTGADGANTRLRGSVSPERVDFWNVTTLLCQAPAGGYATINIHPDSASRRVELQPTPALQAFTFKVPTRDVRVTWHAPGVKVLGYWLEDSVGIVLDDISLRGNSGLSHRRLASYATAQMRQHIDYDIIILEFGMNALSAAQTEYSAYATGMREVVANLSALYPNAQFIVMGIGDRGAKQGTALGSMSTVPALIKAQRQFAAETGSLFWDTRAAMGGEGAAVDWNSRHLLNSDYVHLNHKGGRELARLFLESLDKSTRH